MLAFSQWFIAAGQPPHLTCISPTEGLQDAYRDLAYIGGIPDPNFLHRLQINHVSATEAKREDMTVEMEAYPLADAELWKDKVADVSKITVPTYVVASYSNTLHTMGTFRSWRSIGSKEKWLRIHDTQECPDYYNAEFTEELRKFFDYYLLGKQNGWEKTPTVRYSILDFQANNKTGLIAETFPPRESQLQRYYFSGRTRTLQLNADDNELPLCYFPEALPCRVSFHTVFEKETTFIGYPKVKLFMEAENTDDMDVFVWVQKIDKLGNVLSEFVVPNRNAALQDFTQDGASARHLDPILSTDEISAYSFDRAEKLSGKEIVELNIVLSPIGMTYNEGDTLRVMISSKDEIGSVMPGTPGCITNNKGVHILHTGGKYVEESGFKNFNILLNTITVNYQSTLNYFDNRSTNTSAESFNAKVKAFRSQIRGVRKVDFFLFRLSNLFG
ncbi:CocE/NonD family hydrolase C-terminal non-catalytic domain-containing protein [Flavobacterium sp. NPDC079362]|uniref:CocE/NonD family hydrolase C-terminal non-catalytic domain-containing protein n=1 Tax=Flavobacterium sp. NPDC079362 TaxID=3390566 RepID=UPI003CFE2295